MITLSEAISIAKKKENDKVVSGIEYKECYVFGLLKSTKAVTSSGFYVNKNTGASKWIYLTEPVVVNGKNIVANTEIVRFLSDKDFS